MQLRPKTVLMLVKAALGDPTPRAVRPPRAEVYIRDSFICRGKLFTTTGPVSA